MYLRKNSSFASLNNTILFGLKGWHLPRSLSHHRLRRAESKWEPYLILVGFLIDFVHVDGKLIQLGRFALKGRENTHFVIAQSWFSVPQRNQPAARGHWSVPLLMERVRQDCTHSTTLQTRHSWLRPGGLRARSSGYDERTRGQFLI